MDNDPIRGRCPWCGLELAVWAPNDGVDISHAEPECKNFRAYCELEGFELIDLADAVPQSR